MCAEPAAVGPGHRLEWVFMRILVVDDERSFASLLRRALKRLGHEAVIECDAQAAVSRFRQSEFDAVITDIDMPAMNGVELAVALRAEKTDLPIAFCRGITSDSAVLEAAEAMGTLLPKVWTVADVKRVVEDMRGSRPKLAKGSREAITPPPEVGVDSLDETLEEPARKAPEADSQELGAATEAGSPAAEPGSSPAEPGGSAAKPAGAAPAVPRRLPKVRTNPARPIPLQRRLLITCKSWDQVEQLCDDHGAGRKPLAIKGGYDLSRGDRLHIALALPDELVLSVAAEVISARIDPVDGFRTFGVLLAGLTPEMCARLRAMAQQAEGAGRRVGAYVHVAKREEPSSPRPGGEGAKVLGNLQLKKRGAGNGGFTN